MDTQHTHCGRFLTRVQMEDDILRLRVQCSQPWGNSPSPYLPAEIKSARAEQRKWLYDWLRINHPQC